MGKKLWAIPCQALTDKSKLLTWDEISIPHNNRKRCMGEQSNKV